MENQAPVLVLYHPEAFQLVLKEELLPHLMQVQPRLVEVYGEQ
jgi:hypothetical protein